MEGLCRLFRPTVLQKTINVTELTASKLPLVTEEDGKIFDRNTGIGFKGNQVVSVDSQSSADKSGVIPGDPLDAINILKTFSGHSTGPSISFSNYLEYRKLIVARSSIPSTPSDRSPTEPLGPHPNTSPNTSSHSWSTSENAAPSAPPSNSANLPTVEVNTHQLRFIGADLPSINVGSTRSLNRYNRVVEPITIEGYTIEVADFVKISSTKDGRKIYDVIKPSHSSYSDLCQCHVTGSQATPFGLTLKEIGDHQYMIENITPDSAADRMALFERGDVVKMVPQPDGSRLIMPHPVARSGGFMTGLPENNLYTTI